jgi:hypothetical protein
MTSPDAKKIQIQFLEKINDLISRETSLVQEVSDLLGVSTDSAYRRMRGETLLSIDEIIILCDHFNISFDAFSKIETGLVTFRYSTIESRPESFKAYLKSIMDDLVVISQSKNAGIIYAGGDIPVFHHYRFPQIAAFKMFYWMRSIMNIPEMENTVFGFEAVSEEITELSQKIIELYSLVPSVEIWTDTTIHSTLKQIDYYWESGMFVSSEDAVSVCESLRDVMLNIQKMAENSAKYNKAGIPFGLPEKNYEMYFSDIEITNNCVLVDLGITKAVYLGHFSFYTMSTTNDSYCLKTEEWLSSLIKRSTLISGIAEKQRYQFFKKAYKQIDDLIGKILKSE